MSGPMTTASPSKDGTYFVGVGQAEYWTFPGEIGMPVVSNWCCTAEKLFPGRRTKEQEEATENLKKATEELNKATKTLSDAIAKLEKAVGSPAVEPLEANAALNDAATKLNDANKGAEGRN